jgi:hypothetical protein
VYAAVPNTKFLRVTTSPPCTDDGLLMTLVFGTLLLTMQEHMCPRDYSAVSETFLLECCASDTYKAIRPDQDVGRHNSHGHEPRQMRYFAAFV